MKKSEVKGLVTKDNLKFKYSVEVTNSFKKDFVNCYNRGLDTDLLVQAVKILATDGVLPQNYKPHPLHNNYQGFMPGCASISNRRTCCGRCSRSRRRRQWRLILWS